MDFTKISLTASENRNVSSKKRPLSVVNWNDKQAKVAKNLGMSYVNRNLENIPAKAAPEEEDYLCGPNCQKEGCLVNNNRKLNLFTQFWQTGSHEIQSQILASYMRPIQILNRTNVNNEIRRRINFQYFIPNINGVQIEVCKSTFITVFGVTRKRISNIQNKILDGAIYFSDGRGTHNNRPRPHRIPIDVRETIREHINSYPSYLGHYKRQDGDPVREYLSPDLNIRKMFDNFLAVQGPQASSWIWVYREILRETGLKFGSPASDTCDQCDEFHVKISAADDEEILEILYTESVEHHHNAEVGYRSLSADTNRSRTDPNYVTVCVDMQGILLSPKLSSSSSYFLRKFMLFNFAITQPSNDDTTMCIWNQMEGRRGSKEIGSCLLQYFQNNFVVLEPGQERVLVCWSDRCKGQNNNYQLLCLYKYLISINLFTEINQKFLTTGHSFLPCDRQFALIEKEAKKSSIYSPDDWINIIQIAHHRNPFKIQRMTRTSFLNLSCLMNILPRPRTLKVTQEKWFKVSALHPNIFQSKLEHDSEQWRTHEILNIGQMRSPIEFPQLYLNQIALPACLSNDLKTLQKFIPEEHRSFWQFLNEE